MFTVTATTMMTASRRAAVAACVRTADSVCARTSTVSDVATSDRRRDMDTSRSLGIIV